MNPPTAAEHARLRGHAAPLIVLFAIAAWIFRLHVLGRSVYIGNFDRLNSHLNILTSWVRGIREGASLGWDDVMFTGASLYGLPYTFPNPITFLVALVDPVWLITVAGYASVFLLVVAAWAAYVFMYDICGQRVPSLIGATLYQCSAHAILKVSQNDMSFAVLIHIPVLLLACRRIGASQRGRLWVAVLACALTSLLYFTFLQKAAYTLLLVGAYCVYRSWRLVSWKPVGALVLAFAVAIIVSGPRMMTVAEDFGELTRPVEAGGSRDFDTLYIFQNITPREFFRWFDAGIFGRFPAEAAALGNNINLSEGLLLSTAQLTPFLFGIVALRSRRRWLPLFRPTSEISTADVPFLAGVVLAVLAIVLVRPVAHLFFLSFLKVDFTHARVVIVALLPMCTLVAWWLADARGNEHQAWSPVQASALLAVAAVAGGALAWSVEQLGHRADGVRFELDNRVGYMTAAAVRAMVGETDPPVPPVPASLAAGRIEPGVVALKWSDSPGEDVYRIEKGTGPDGPFSEIGDVPAETTDYRVGDLPPGETSTFRVRGCNRAGCSDYTPVAVALPGNPTNPEAFGETARREATWFHAGRVARVIWSAIVLMLLCGGIWLARRRPPVRWVIVHVVAFMALAQAVASANYQVNGDHFDTEIPFQNAAFLRGAPGEFQVPSPQIRDALRRRLENDAYRTALICDRDTAPMFCAAHISYFWGLRVAEGYSSGLPTRLAALPWPTDVISLRAISFTTADQLPWPVLSILNVKHALRVDAALYRNRYASDHDVASVEILSSPVGVTPRAFFAASVVPAADLAGAVRTLFPSTSFTKPPDVAARSVVEGFGSSTSFTTEGTIVARYDRATVSVDISPASAPRFLVLNELYHPRWRAFSSQGELTVYPANAAMRGVVVPPGVDNVRFEFLPAYRTATAVPAAGLGLVLLAVGLRRGIWAASDDLRHRPGEATL